MRRMQVYPGRGLLLMAPLLLLACSSVKEVVGPTHVEVESNAPSDQEFYVVTQRRADAKQPFYVMKPAHPEATVLLFAGGSGLVNVRYGLSSGNFLIRSAGLFFDQNLMVAAVTTPTDRITLERFRHSRAHALDIKGVIAELRKLADVPVWAVGTSNGSASVANVGSRFQPPAGPDGVVFTSSVGHSRLGNDVFGADLTNIVVPALIVHDTRDACPASPFAVAGQMKASLWNAPAVQVIAIHGGGTPFGNPCDAHHYHGFIGREAEVVKDIADWIKAHPPGPAAAR